MIYYIYYDSDALLMHELQKITANTIVLKIELNDNNILHIASELTSTDLLTPNKSFVIEVDKLLATNKETFKTNHIQELIHAINISSYNIILTSTHKIIANSNYVTMLDKKIVIKEFITSTETILNFLKDIALVNDFEVTDDILLKMITDFESDIFKLQNELLKIGTYSPIITSSTYNKIATVPLNTKVFSLATLLALDKKTKVRAVYQNLILEGHDPISILNILISQLDFFILIKISAPLQYQRVLNQMNIHPYRITQAQKSVQPVSLNSLQSHLLNLVELDFLCKSGKLETEFLLEFILYPYSKK